MGRILEEGRRSGKLRFAGDGEAVGMVLFSLLEGAMLVSRAHGGIRQFRRTRDQVLKLLGA